MGQPAGWWSIIPQLILIALEAVSLLWSRDLKRDYKVEAPMWGFSAHPLIDGKKLICMVGGKGIFRVRMA